MEAQTHTHTNTHTDRDRQTHTHTHIQKQTHTQTQPHTHTHTGHKHTHRNTERKTYELLSVSAVVRRSWMWSDLLLITAAALSRNYFKQNKALKLVLRKT